MLVHRRVTPSSKFAGTHLYTWVERGTMRVKCLAQQRNALPRPGLEPAPPDPEMHEIIHVIKSRLVLVFHLRMVVYVDRVI